jgi:uncharacterized protein
VKVVSDASPIITFARIGYLDLLPKVYGRIYISTEVYNEVVVAGAGLPGATQAAQADWIDATPVQNTEGLAIAIANIGLGPGELSAVVLATELSADLVLIDEEQARRYAAAQGLNVTGCIGILESLYRRGDLIDLRGAYIQMLAQKFRIDIPTLQHSLAKFKLSPL